MNWNIWNDAQGDKKYIPDVKPLPCPFCRSGANTYAKPESICGDIVWLVEVVCHDCGAIGPPSKDNRIFDEHALDVDFSIEREAVNYSIKLWNKR